MRGLIDVKEGKRIYWDDFRDDHPLTKPFYDWRRGANPDFADETLRPFVKRYWEVDVDKDKSLVVSTYQDDKNSPALVELKRGEEDKADKRGRVLLFTTRLDRRPEDPSDPDRNNFYDGSFGLVLDQRGVQVPGRRFVEGGPQLHLRRPGRPAAAGVRPARRLPAERTEQRLSESERSITVDAKDSALQIRAASAPGQYSVFDPNGKLFTAFSLNVSSDESQLERLPAADVEKVLGPGSVLTAQPGVSLNGPLRAGRGRHDGGAAVGTAASAAAADDPDAAVPDVRGAAGEPILRAAVARCGGWAGRGTGPVMTPQFDPVAPWKWLFLGLSGAPPAVVAAVLMAGAVALALPILLVRQTAWRRRRLIVGCGLIVFGLLTWAAVGHAWETSLGMTTAGGVWLGRLAGFGLPLLYVVPMGLAGLTAATYLNSGRPPRRVAAILALRGAAFLLAAVAILRPYSPPPGTATPPAPCSTSSSTVPRA